MNILVTNDDGIMASGLWAAAQVLAEAHQVIVVAPSTNYSGYGAALPPQREVGCQPYPAAGSKIAGIPAFSIAAPPAVCVQVGLSGALSKMPIDLVVSGVNHGANIGRDVIYSGTVGAALTAYLLGRPAIAVSLDIGPGGIAHWETAAWCAKEVVRSLMSAPIIEPTVLNVNIPNRPLAELAGIEVTGLSSASCLNAYDIHLEGEAVLRFERTTVASNSREEPGSDAWALAQGCVSVTPLRLFPDILYLSPSLLGPERMWMRPPAFVGMEQPV